MSLQKTATIVSSSVAFILVVVKLVVWIFSWSIAVLSSAIDSLLDFCVSLFNFFAVKQAEKWRDDQYNYGRWKIEALASFLEWLIIFVSASYILFESVSKIINKEEVAHIWVSLYVMMFSLILTLGLVLFLMHVAKKTWSLVIKSDALHYKTDVLTNIWILVWLVVIKFTGFHMVDAIIWILIALYIGYSSIELIKTGYDFLMDASLDEEVVDEIKTILKKSQEIRDYHMLHTRKSVWLNFVSVHLVFDYKTSLVDAHKSAHIIEDKIKSLDKDNAWEIVTHLDPYNDELCDDFEH